VAGERWGACLVMVFAPGELDAACAALICSHITNDRWTIQEIFVAASDAGIDWPMFANRIANMAGRMLVSVLGAQVQPAELAEAFANAAVVAGVRSDGAL
jgi:hypothetical protein